MKSRPAASRPLNRRPAAGFTLIELMVTVVILAVVGVVLSLVMLSASRSRRATANSIESAQAARAGLDLIARDLRSAGYGADLDYTVSPQPPIAYVDSLQILINANLNPYPDTTVQRRPPLAYNPAGFPRPFPLNGTSWQPPIKYRTGAEVVRWTLDLDNNGLVDANDIASLEGIDAQQTPNPNDYVLVRQVYGDSTSFVSGNNGGAIERVALIRRPGGTVPPLFTVYLKGKLTPWDWASGPVPASELSNIERIVVQMTAPSSRPDWQGKYAETHLRTEVNSLRNTPTNKFIEYAVSGYVYDDKNKNKVRDGEPGLADVEVTLGTYSTITDATGFYQFKVPEGTYVLKHTPPVGYGAFDKPDSFVFAVPPATSRSFADTAASGGWLTAIVWHDLDRDNKIDGGEPFLGNIKVYVAGDTSSVTYTEDDGTGSAKLFCRTGPYQLFIAPPDSFTTSSPNPATGTMTNGGSKTHNFGIYLQNFGTIKGRVFSDDNRNGIRDGGEPGLKDVWVGVEYEGTAEQVAFAYSGNNGDYSINVPVNDPPKTKPYTIRCIPPPGYVNGASINGLFVQDKQVLTNQDLGVGSFIIITANADRVLAVASGDLIENDWSLSIPATPRGDVDIVLGAEASQKENVMVWFNDYEKNPLFKKDPTYFRDAPQSVLAIALDTLDSKPDKKRLDLITGTRHKDVGNFFVWFTQNSTGNEGYLPATYSQAYKTLDNGDVQVVLTMDCTGGAGPDILLGTRGTVTGQGTFEVWENSDATTPTFTRKDTYPPKGGMPFGMGEVNAMQLADFNKNGKMDIAIGTRTGIYTGQVLIFEHQGKAASEKWKYMAGYTTPSDIVTALTVLDVDGDGWLDIVTGTHRSMTQGNLQFWKNNGTSTLGFTLNKTETAPGIVTALASGDFGGISRPDLLIGWREDEGNYKGGIQLWYTDGGFPKSGIDPSGGSIKNMVTSITTNNFNFGVYPTEPSPPYLLDFAVGVKVSANNGQLVVFIR